MLRNSAHPDIYFRGSREGLNRSGQATRNNFASHEAEAVVQRSIDALARLTQSGADPWTVALSVSRIQGDGRTLRSDTLLKKGTLETHLEQQTLRQGLENVVSFAKEKQWAKAGVEARTWLGRDAEVFADRKTDLRQQTRAGFREVSYLALRLEGVEKVRATLQTETGKTAQGMAEAFRGIDRQTLPEELRPVADGLLGLADLQVAATQPWKEPPNPASLQKSLADFQQALRLVPGEPPDSALIARFQQDLAFKGFLEGHSDTARALWPANGPKEHAVQVLRDMKAMLTGRGEVVTEASQRAIGPESGGASPGGLPPGLKPLLPEGPREGWRPPVRGSATEGLPPLKEAVQKVQSPLKEAVQKVEPLRQVATTHLEKARQELEGKLHAHFHHLHQLHGQVVAQDEEEEKRLKELEVLLGESLQPAERLWARHELRTQPAAAVATKLRGQRQEELVAKKLERVRHYLDLPPGVDEQSSGPKQREGLQQARKLLQQGMELDDVVARLADALPPSRRAAGDIRTTVRVDDVIHALEPGPDTFELAQIQDRIGQGCRPADVAALISRQRRVKHDLERVQSYLDRPLTPAELADVRRMLEGEPDGVFRFRVQAAGLLIGPGAGPLPALPWLHQQPKAPASVADVVVSFAEALSPERRRVPGGIRDAVLLDEVRGELPDMDAREYAQARQLLRQGATPAAVVLTLRAQRPGQLQVVDTPD
jgi:hypothetical protein